MTTGSRRLLVTVPGHVLRRGRSKKDTDGDVWVLGRVDDVMNVSGHRLSTTESNPPWSPTPRSPKRRRRRSDDMTGQAVCSYVILRESAATVEPTS